MATYGPEIDQSQHGKSVSHIINCSTNCILMNTNLKCDFTLMNTDTQYKLRLYWRISCILINTNVTLH